MSRVVGANALIRYGLPGALAAAVILTIGPRSLGPVAVNLGYRQLMRAVSVYPYRARFEIAQVGVPTDSGRAGGPVAAAERLEASQGWFKTARRAPTDQPLAALGWLRAAALAGAGSDPDLVALGQAEGLDWELALLALNAGDAQAAGQHYMAACARHASCLPVVERLVKAARYAEGVVLLRELIYRPGLPPGVVEQYYEASRQVMPLPGLVHADIVANCAAFLGAAGGGPAWPLPANSALADIRALCAEGLLTDPRAAQGTGLGTPQEYAALAVRDGGPTRYRLLMYGWAELEAGRPDVAAALLRQARQSTAAAYQHGLTDEQVHTWIERLLARTGQ